jgi:septal ring factor EnvC (AmiA/AmiB activator)
MLVLAMMLSVTTAYSQKNKKSKTAPSETSSTEAAPPDDKAAEKEWAKKLKSLKPLQYKALVEEKDKLQQQVNEATSQAAQCRDNMTAIQSENERLKREMEELNAKVVQSTQTQNQVTATSGGVVPGVIFKVQIGAFRNKDLSKYLNNSKNFSGDTDADGTRKYTLGAFTDYWEADNFKKYLREMGVKDAWVVAYKDGNRISIKEALEGVTVVK